MIRIDTTRAARTFASRPVRIAVAMKIAFAILAANVSFAAAKAILHKAPEAAAPQVAARVSTTTPFILPIVAEEPATLAQSDAADACHTVDVETDEGYGVRGHVTRIVCHKAL